ncbi:aminoacyl-tRNA deacylase [Thermodesulfobacteriota bacterium]
MSTRAINFLKQKGVFFEVVKYEHEEKGAEFAATATGFPLNKTIKTLMVDLGNEKYQLVLVPGDKQLVLKRLAKVCAVKRVSMADVATAERLTGYLVGGISPFGIRRKIPVIMEESLLKFDSVLINAGQRGTMLKMAPGDIVSVLDCYIADVAEQENK